MAHFLFKRYNCILIEEYKSGSLHFALIHIIKIDKLTYHEIMPIMWYRYWGEKGLVSVGTS